MPNAPTLKLLLLGAGLLLLATAAPSHAQTRKTGHAEVQTATEATSPAADQSDQPAPSVTRRTDAHTINVTMDSGSAEHPASTPKQGSPSDQAASQATPANGLPPAFDAGSFQARPVTERPASSRTPF